MISKDQNKGQYVYHSLYIQHMEMQCNVTYINHHEIIITMLCCIYLNTFGYILNVFAYMLDIFGYISHIFGCILHIFGYMLNILGYILDVFAYISIQFS